MDLAPSRATRDLLPPDGSVMRACYDRAAGLARLHGFRYVETPTFEATELFARTSGATSDVVSKEMYTFTDRGDRSLTLRPEGTAPVMRAYLRDQQRLGAPFKSYYLTRMFRYSRPQAGRFREHRQFGVEVFGTDAPAADVEVMLVGDAFLRSLGLERYHLEVNTLGDETCRPAYREALTAYLREHRDELRDEHRDRFEENPLRVLDCKDDACRAVAAGAPKMLDHLCDECRAHFQAVVDGVTTAGLEPLVAPTLVRGLDYYTRTTFEFKSDDLSAQDTICGGGRYDGLIEEIGGPPTPGIGFGAGVERLLLSVPDADRKPPPLDVYFVTTETADRARILPLLSELRRRGLRADMDYGGRSQKGQLGQAGKLGAGWTVIVEDGRATVREPGRDDWTVPLGELVDRISE